MIQKTEGSGFGKALISVLALLLSLCIGGQADALPVTWTVTRADDNPSIPAPGSFRHTVMFANHGDTIVFSGEAATVVLADQVAIDKTLIITGPATIRQGAQHRRVLEVTATCTMHEITITDGNFTSPEFYLERLNGAGIRDGRLDDELVQGVPQRDRRRHRESRKADDVFVYIISQFDLLALWSGSLEYSRPRQ